jgi:hypothetical protein
MADLSPLIGFARRKGRKERERDMGARVCVAKIQIKFEFFKLG